MAGRPRARWITVRAIAASRIALARSASTGITVLAGACAAITHVAVCGAQTPPPRIVCPVKPFRWAEDCSALRAEHGALLGVERLRFIPLADSGLVWLTLGGEYRFKTEYLDAPDFGIGPGADAYTAFGERLLAQADLRTTLGIRAFVQLSAATDAGRKPAERPFDRSRPDIAQAFIDVPLPGAAVLRVGWQELDAGGNRLISTREAANLRLAFDMAHLAASIAGFDAVAFYGRPVLNQRGAFDDRGNPSEKFLGGWL